MRNTIVWASGLAIAVRKAGALSTARPFGRLFLPVVLGSTLSAALGSWGAWRPRRGKRRKTPVAGTPSADLLETQGTVVDSRLVWNHVEITFEFTARGKRRRGKHEIRVSPSDPNELYRDMLRRREIAACLARYPRGSPVRIQYNPANLSQSVLLESGEVQAKGVGG